MLSTALIGYQVVQMCQASQKCLLTPSGMMEPLHHEWLPIRCVMCLI